MRTVAPSPAFGPISGSPAGEPPSLPPAGGPPELPSADEPPSPPPAERSPEPPPAEGPPEPPPAGVPPARTPPERAPPERAPPDPLAPSSELTGSSSVNTTSAVRILVSSPGGRRSKAPFAKRSSPLSASSSNAEAARSIGGGGTSAAAPAAPAAALNPIARTTAAIRGGQLETLNRPARFTAVPTLLRACAFEAASARRDPSQPSAASLHKRMTRRQAYDGGAAFRQASHLAVRRKAHLPGGVSSEPPPPRRRASSAHSASGSTPTSTMATSRW